MKRNVFSKIFLASSLYLLSFSLSATVSKLDMNAIDSLSNEAASWWKSVSSKTAKPVALLPVTVNKKLEENFALTVEDIFASKLSVEGASPVMVCHQCHAPEIIVQEDKMIVSKGLPDNKRLIEIAEMLKVDSFLKIRVNKTPLKMIVTLSWLEPKTNILIATKTLSVTNARIADSAMQFKLAAGIQFEMIPKRDPMLSERVPFSIDFTWLEYIGGGTKAGISVGAIIFSETYGHLAYLQPELSWKIRLGRSPFAIQPSVRGGVGARGTFATAPTMGATAGASFDIFMGEIFFIGAKADAFFPLHNKEVDLMTVYPGVHIGFSLGK